MKSTIINGKEVSQITLGTVQLGMNYGIANTDGQPSGEKSNKMLSIALENGITSLDTARAYGTSEDVLGGFFKAAKPEKMPFITSKFVVGLEPDATDAEVEKKMYTSVETSLEKLNINQLDCLMIHQANEMTKHGRIVPKTLERLIKEGYIKKAGVSVYEPEELDTMFSEDVYTATQIPMSLFDQKLIKRGYMDKLSDKNISVFVRSVFLQGLFFLDTKTVDDPILKEFACPHIDKLAEFCREADMSIAEFAISFIRDVPGVTSLVLGADTPEQIKENIDYINAKAIDADLRARTYEAFSDVNLPKIMEVLRRPKKGNV